MLGQVSLVGLESHHAKNVSAAALFGDLAFSTIGTVLAVVTVVPIAPVGTGARP